MIPIEGSMAENRHRYPCFLHISLCLLSTILGSFGVLGYLRFGNETNQIVTENLKGSAIVIILRCLLFFGVLFTYPLQIYPVIQIVEGILFKSKNQKQIRKMNAVVNSGFDNSSSVSGLLQSDSDENQLMPAVKVSPFLFINASIHSIANGGRLEGLHFSLMGITCSPVSLRKSPCSLKFSRIIFWINSQVY